MAEEEVGLRLTLKERQAVARGLADTKGDLEDVAGSADDVSAAGKRAERGLLSLASGKVKSGLLSLARGGRSLVSTIGSGLVTATKAGAVGLTALAVAAAGVSVKAVGLAGDARETASAFDTVFGPSARGVQKDLDSLTRQFGLYNPELQDAARQFGVFGKAAGISRKDLAGFSTDLVDAGLDLGSFYNQDPSEVFGALQSGLSGEAEPLRQFGIFISDAAMKAQAAQMGLTDELTEQQKVMVRHRLILKSLGDAQGDLARTSGGLANQQRAGEGRTKTFLKMLGGPMATAATGFWRGFNAVAKAAIRELRQNLPGLEVQAGGLSKRFARWGRQLAHELPTAISTTVAWWDQLKGRLDGMSWGGTQQQVGLLRDDVEDLGPALAAAGEQLPGLSDMLAVVGTVTGFLADHTDLLAKAMPYLVFGYAALKASQLAANIVLAASLPLKIAELVTNRQLTKSNAALVASRTAVTTSTVVETAAVAANTGAQNVGLVARARATAGAIAHSVATKAIAALTAIWTGAQWLLNAALTANPIGLVVVGIGLLVGAAILAYRKVGWFHDAVDGLFGVLKKVWGVLMDNKQAFLILLGPVGLVAAGFITLYRRSETFRSAIDFLWNKVLKPFGSFLGGAFLGYFKLLAKGYLMMARFGGKAFTWLLQAAFMTFDGILTAADKGLGWVPGLGDKIKGARKAFNEFGDATIGKLDALSQKLKETQDRVNDLGRDRSATITITTVRTGKAPLINTGMGPQDDISPRTGLLPKAPGGGHTERSGTRGPVVLPQVPRLSSPPALPVGDVDVPDDDDAPDLGGGGDLHVTLELDGRAASTTVVKDFRKRGNRK